MEDASGLVGRSKGAGKGCRYRAVLATFPQRDSGMTKDPVEVLVNLANVQAYFVVVLTWKLCVSSGSSWSLPACNGALHPSSSACAFSSLQCLA